MQSRIGCSMLLARSASSVGSPDSHQFWRRALKNFTLVMIAFTASSGCYYNASNYVNKGRPEASFVVMRNVPTTVVMSGGLRKPFVDVMVPG